MQETERLDSFTRNEKETSRQQSGEMPLRITNLVADSQLIHKIRLLVMKILEKDPDLINVNNKIINNYLKLIINKKNIWEYIS